MVIGDLPAYLKNILDGLPRGTCFFEKKGALRNYTTEEGTSIFGPEIYHGNEWKANTESIPEGAIVLGLVVSSDETVALNRTRFPIRISIMKLF
jgi:hypothetical protein